MSEEKKEHVIDQPPPQRVANFVERYANNAQFESTVWDLKVVFGALDQTVPGSGLRQHTAITVSWAQAKVLAYFVYVNVLFQEAANGKVTVPDAVKPPTFDSFLDEMADTDPTAQSMKTQIARLYAELFG